MKKSTVIMVLAALMGLLVLGWLIGCNDNPTSKNPVESNVDGTSLPGPPKPPYDPPTITCGTSTSSTITIHVCGGTSGAPAGFSIQWLEKSYYDHNGWDGTECKASFSGQAQGGYFSLDGPDDCVDVTIGSPSGINGETFQCTGELLCDTDYVFRAFAHGDDTHNRSDFTANLTCPTGACEENCTLTQGFWQTHGPGGCVKGGNTNAWPVTSLTLGNVTYTDVELCSIFQAQISGNGLIILAQQLIAAKLNIANGASVPSSVQDCIDAADALIGDLVVPPVNGSTDSLDPSETSDLTECLDSYNKGDTGPGHCD